MEFVRENIMKIGGAGIGLAFIQVSSLSKSAWLNTCVCVCVCIYNFKLIGFLNSLTLSEKYPYGSFIFVYFGLLVL